MMLERRTSRARPSWSGWDPLGNACRESHAGSMFQRHWAAFLAYIGERFLNIRAVTCIHPRQTISLLLLYLSMFHKE